MRTVFITGAARGIGAATAERFGVIEVNLFGVLRTLGVAGQVVS